MTTPTAPKPLRVTQDAYLMADARNVDALDVWLRIPECEILHQIDPCECDDEAEAEANVFPHEGRFQVQWYLNSVGLVTAVDFTTHEDAQAWLESEGFQDFSS